MIRRWIRRAAWLRRIGGPSAVTRWSWILTAPFAVTVMGSYVSARGPWDWPAHFGVALMVHLVMGAVLFLAWLTVLRPDRTRTRPVLALTVFGAIGACRPFLLDALLEFQGYEADARPMLVRVVINVSASVIGLSLVALLVDAVREHKAMMQRLRGARQAVDEQRRADEKYLAGLGQQCAADLAGRIDWALSRGERVGLDSVEASRLLRSISEDIVRPMSHALFDDTTALPPPTVEPPEPTRRERTAAVMQAVRPAPLVMPVLLYNALAVVYLVTSYGWREAVLQLVAGFAICVPGNWIVARTVPRIRGAVRRLVAMAVAYSGIAAATGYVLWLILGSEFPPVFVLPGIAFYPFACMVIALTRAANAKRAREKRELATALGEQSRSAAEVHGRVVAARRRLAHVLHSSVQGELVAAALALHAADPGTSATRTSIEDHVGQLIDRLLADVARAEVRPGVSRADARQQITELIGMWSAAVPITTAIDDDVWPLLSESPRRLEHAIDVLSEGFTNAIRHGSDGALEVAMTVDPRTSLISIGIRSPGRISEVSSDGLGLALLSTKVESAELVEEPGTVLLAVSLH